MMASMEGINAYSRPGLDGSVIVDIERMLVDAIAVAKAAGADKSSFLEMVGTMFDEVIVKVRIPNRAKN